MQIAIAITLIICGTLLILAPAAHNLMLASTSDVVWRGMSGPYQFGCWLTGISMIATAVMCSVKFDSTRATITPAVA
jgi:hypothetical protein